MTKRLIYVFYIFDDIKSFDEISMYKVHFNCLKHFANVFNNVQFIISVDDLNNTLIDDVKNFANDTFKHCEKLDIFVEKNIREHREGKWYIEYVVKKLDVLDGYTFFAHTKGVQNVHLDNKFPWMWTTMMYWFNLYFDPHNLLGDTYYASGFPFVGCGGYPSLAIEGIKNQAQSIKDYYKPNCDEMFPLTGDPEMIRRNNLIRRSKFDNLEHVWQFTGSFYWMNCQKIAKFIKDNDLFVNFSENNLPWWYDLKYIAENYMTDLFTWNEINAPYKYIIMAINKYQDVNNLYKDETYGEHYSWYMDEYAERYLYDYIPYDTIALYKEFHNKMISQK